MGRKESIWWLFSLSVHSLPLCTVNARLLSGSHVHHIHNLSSWYKEIVKCKSCLVVCGFYCCLCVLCKSRHFLCVLHRSCHFLFKSIAKAWSPLFFVCCQESTVPCLSTVFCLLSSLSGVLAFVLFGVDPLLSGVCYFPSPHFSLRGLLLPFAWRTVFCLLSGVLFLCCAESTAWVRHVLSHGGGGPALCVWRGDEHLCKF